jgi:hypothetical protein
MHVRDDQAFQCLDIVYACLEQCDALATEYDLNEKPAPDLAHATLLPHDRKLADYFRPKQYLKLKSILQKAFGINIDQFARFKPLMVINVISEHLLPQDRPQALDIHLWQYAGQRGKQQLGIETLDEQLRVIQSIPIKLQLEQLRSLGRNVSKFRKMTLKNAGIYQSNDPQRIYRMVRRSSQGLRKLLLFQRNRIMAERIDGIVRRQATLCAVGAGHLSGREGLIRLLKLRGFKLRPITMILEEEE